jgi:hypothetical protein
MDLNEYEVQRGDRRYLVFQPALYASSAASFPRESMVGCQKVKSREMCRRTMGKVDGVKGLQSE